MGFYRTLFMGHLAASFIVQGSAFGQDKAFKIGDQVRDMNTVIQENQGAFYEVEKQKFDLVEKIARDEYLEYFWEKEGKKAKKSPEEFKETYLKKNAKVSEGEVKETLAKFKDHPQLKKMSDAEREKAVRKYLGEKSEQEAISGIIEAGMKSNDLKILIETPKEPRFEMVVTADDPVRYGPGPKDTNPMGCKGDQCPVTIVEYSEFQCPFCKRVQDSMHKVMETYKGKIRFAAREFPLDFHDRAKPAAVAARCAWDQGKYWEMYDALFTNQQALAESDFERHAKAIGLNEAKFKDCLKNPGKITALIEKNEASGRSAGVSGTPAYFINGRRLSGALPFEEFKRIIDEELSTKKAH